MRYCSPPFFLFWVCTSLLGRKSLHGKPARGSWISVFQKPTGELLIKSLLGVFDELYCFFVFFRFDEIVFIWVWLERSRPLRRLNFVNDIVSQTPEALLIYTGWGLNALIGLIFLTFSFFLYWFTWGQSIPAVSGLSYLVFFCLFFIYFLFPWHIRLFPCTPAPAAIHVFSLVVWIFFLLLVVVEAVGRRMAEISIISGMIAFYRRNVFDKTFKKSRLFSYYIEIKTANILERTSVNIKHFTLLWDSF